MQTKTIFGRAVGFLLIGFLGHAGGAQAQQPAPEEKTVTFEVKDRDLREVVDHIRQGSGVNIVIDEDVQATVTLSLSGVPWRQALELAAEEAGCIVVELGTNLLKVEKPPRVHFAFENADINKVIDAVAKVSGANIIVGPEVKGTVSVRLNNVPFRDALDTVAKTLGYTVVQEKRGILRVVDPVTLKTQVESRAFQLKFIRPPGPYTPLIESDFVSGPKKGGSATAGTDLKKTFRLLEALEKALTKDGKLDYIDRHNVVIVSDIPPVLDRIQKMIERIDVEPRQVFVDVKFVTTSNTGLMNLGMDFGSAGPQASVSLGKIPIEYPFHVGKGGFEDSLLPHNIDHTVYDNQGPFTQKDETGETNPGDASIPSIVYGALDFTTVQAALRLLRSDANTDILQAPKVIALDHQAATIFVGEKVPYAEAKTEQGQAGGLSLSVVEAPKSPVSIGFQLMIIPHSVPGSQRILIDVIPTQTSLTGAGTTVPGFDTFTVGASGLSGTISLPRIASSTIATSMVLESGHTAVIGGLSTLTKSETVRGIPLLMDIPLIGFLFKNENSTDDRRNLIVLITPTLIQTSEESDRLLERELKERNERYKSRLQEIFPTSVAPASDTAGTGE